MELQLTHKPGQPVAGSYGLLSRSYRLLGGMVACSFRLLGTWGTLLLLATGVRTLATGLTYMQKASWGDLHAQI